MLQSTTGP